MEQLVARRAHNPKVVGSSPAPATESDKLEISSFVRFFLLLTRCLSSKLNVPLDSPGRFDKRFRQTEFFRVYRTDDAALNSSICF
jgi:hypothetical protein